MANVLKSTSVPERTKAAHDISGLAGFNLSDLADEGRSRLDQCRTQVRKMLDDAKVEAEKLRLEAEERGYQEGLKRADADIEKRVQKESEARAKESLSLINQAVQKMHLTYDGWMNRYSQSLQSISLAVAERIVRRKLVDEPEILVQWAEEALTSTRTATKLTLAVHPETLAQLGDSLDQMLASPSLPEQTHVEPDESLARDSVAVRQLGGEIQAGLDAQLSRLQELLS
ncbi:flagellar assembly protein H [Rubripirellula lacrimiformis]|uniref:Flagellar assembly protein FliH n=1 Tax=Rubripirellula lacrimiformis TaxID=1930273 RepID=A0A517N6I7_9BACT|nr:FliH/SctL family protein [Rubripirellula lacrimiformis]QDT02742.1 flagellar assembly protein H [Rubripirellula lacrimiformis]